MTENKLSWENMSLLPEILLGVHKKGFERPYNSVQQNAIMTILQGRDVIIKKSAGTGKTVAFIIPALQKIDTSNPLCQVLILVHSRELAKLVQEEVLSLGSFIGSFQCRSCVGGSMVRPLMLELESECQIVVGTPGRVLDMIKRGSLKVDSIEMLIVDEFDDFIQRQFKDLFLDVFRRLNSSKQIVVAAPTMPKEVVELTTETMNDPVWVTQ